MSFIVAVELGRSELTSTTAKKYRNLSLQNTVMQLRKVCSHPFLFDWPLDSETHMPVIDESLVHASGKMMVLERLLVLVLVLEVLEVLERLVAWLMVLATVLVSEVLERPLVVWLMVMVIL